MIDIKIGNIFSLMIVHSILLRVYDSNIFLNNI